MTRAKSILERFFWTAVAAFIGVLPVTIPLTTNGAKAAAWAGIGAAIAATISLAKNLVLTPGNPNNIAERVLWTFVQAGVGALVPTVHLNGHDLKAMLLAALGAGIAAVVSLAKNLTLSLPSAPPVAPVVAVIPASAPLVLPPKPVEPVSTARRAGPPAKRARASR